MRTTNRIVKKMLLLTACLAAIAVNANSATRAFAAAGEGGAAPAQPADGLAPVKIWEQNGEVVFAIQDRPGQMSITLFSGPATPEERAKYFKDGRAESGVSAFLLQTQGRNFLFDAGFGQAAPGESRLMEQLAQLGLAAEDIDAVLLSHMHTDHIGGLVTQDGLRVFPKARLVVSAVESDYWQVGQAEPAKTGGKAAEPSLNTTLAQQAIAAYGDDVRKFFGGPLSEALGLETTLMALPAFGHTPGHTVYSLGAYAPRLLILGDLLHAVELQFAIPQESAQYDHDQQAAIFVRESILSLAAETHALVAGMHIPFPCAGYAIKEGKGFRFVPME